MFFRRMLSNVKVSFSKSRINSYYGFIVRCLINTTTGLNRTIHYCKMAVIPTENSQLQDEEKKLPDTPPPEYDLIGEEVSTRSLFLVQF